MRQIIDERVEDKATQRGVRGDRAESPDKCPDKLAKCLRLQGVPSVWGTRVATPGEGLRELLDHGRVWLSLTQSV
jgi:hypothetical protein